MTPANKTLAPNMTQQYTATGHYSDNTVRDLSASAAWSSSSAAIATVSPSGVVTGKAAGTTTIGASVGGVTGAASGQVSPLRSITLRPLVNIVRAGGTRTLTATGRFANGVSANITNQVTWVSTNSGIAGVSPQGLVTAQSPGGVAVFAVFGNAFTLPAGVLVL
ncbi:MAG TPA: Ig-like domain-containing protein [Acidimicrobiia bacterium]|nr:Ig-like domain-containing protein [Acidimicrobiia bacterium]